MKLYNSYNLNIKRTILLMVLIGIIVSIIINPEIAIDSAKDGLYLWFNILLPSLLPFLVLSELFISSGFVQLFGKLLGPIMKPIFNVSGSGAFPLLMSIISGYPVGAKLTSDLRKSKLITKDEGNRLITFTSTSGPLFILGSVLIGMLNLPQFSLLMILPHYLGIITVGILFRFYKTSSNASKSKYKNSIYTMNHIGINNSDNKESLGKIISTSVKKSIDSILLVGGFVIVYNVIINLLLISKFMKQGVVTISNCIGTNPQVIEGIFAGVIELTTGCQKISIVNINPIYKIMIINFLIGWGGLSILSQAISFISQTDISSLLFLFSKFLHGIFSCIFTYIIYLLKFKDIVIPSYSDNFIMENKYNIYNWIYSFFGSIKLALGVCIYFIVLSLFVHQLWVKGK